MRHFVAVGHAVATRYGWQSGAHVFEPLLLVAEEERVVFLKHDAFQCAVVGDVRIVKIAGRYFQVPLLDGSLYAIVVSFGCFGGTDDAALGSFRTDELHFGI